MISSKEINLEKEIVYYIDWLSNFGKDKAGGITRLLYTDEWKRAQDGLKNLMEEMGFDTYFDRVGNLFGRLEGSLYKDETILTGSHIDTVVNGGRYDGQFGIIGGILALKYLKENYGQPLRNIEVVSIAEEEGSRFPFAFWGSKNIIGLAKREMVENLRDVNGLSFVDEMQRLGFDFNQPDYEGRKDLKAFIELHIEQGGVLEKEQKSIGIVHHIVGQRRFTIEVRGESNHAGTTPMGYRKDALYGASQMIKSIIDKAYEYGDPLVATVGSIELEPNTVNVVPGRVVFTLDTRHICKEALEEFTQDVERIIEEISTKMGLITRVQKWMDCDPIAMDEELVEFIKNRCEKEGISYKLMHSGAGHDSQKFANEIPTAMIFVPSHKGISHSPEEYTEPKDLAEGVKVLIGILKDLAY